jgi:hypothetical protein
MPPPPFSPPPPKAAPPPPPAPPSAAAARERFRPPGTPPGGSPVPPISEGRAEAPVRKGRGPLFWVTGGCCGCLLLALLLAGALGGGIYYMTKGAAEVAHGHVQRVKAGEIERAYDDLSTSYKAELSLQDFEQLVALHPSLKDNTSATFMSRSVHNDTAKISGVLVSPGGAEPVTFFLVREGGAWKISGIRFAAE